MRLPNVALAGVQVPRVRHAPKTRANAWEDVADLAAAYGLHLDPWQENVLQAAMGERADGQWATPRVGVAVPRQNGKGALIEARELAGLLLFGEELILHSAHDQKTARIGFDRIVSYFENFDDLRKRVKQIGTALNREYLQLKTGQTLRFLARSKSSGRGFSADCLFLDEAQELSDGTWSAILPTTSARPNPQIWLLGTPPSPLMNGEVFTRFRQAGLEGKDLRLCWCEWSADPRADLDDRAAWAQANPSLGAARETGVTLESIADERSAMDDESFGRERLGMWDDVASSRVIDAATWARCADSTSQVASEIAISVDTTPDQSVTSIAIAGLRDDGLPHVEVIENRRGPLDWVVPRLVELVGRWHPRALVIDEYSPAMVLVDGLAKEKIAVTTTRTRDMVAACGQLYSSVMSGRVRHIDQPLLNTALSVARKRQVGDGGGWAWHRKGVEDDITPLVSATLALWGVGADKAKVKRPKRRSGRSGGGRRAVML